MLVKAVRHNILDPKGPGALPWQDDERVAVTGDPLVYAVDSLSTSNYYRGVSGEGLAGGTSMWAATLFILDSTPVGSDYLHMRGQAAVRGWRLYVTSANRTLFSIVNGVGTNVTSPNVGSVPTAQVSGVVGTYDGATVRCYLNRAQLGSGTAATGYTAPNAGDLYAIGVRSNATSPFDTGKILGTCGGTGVPSLANIQSWFDNAKTAKDVVDMVGATTTHMFSVRENGRTIPPTWVEEKATGEDLTRTGTPTLHSEEPTWAW